MRLIPIIWTALLVILAVPTRAENNQILPLVLIDSSSSLAVNDTNGIQKVFQDSALYIQKRGQVPYLLWSNEPKKVRLWDGFGPAKLGFLTTGRTEAHKALADIQKQFHFCSGVVMLIDDDGVSSASPYKTELESVLYNNVAVYVLIVSFATRDSQSNALAQELRWLSWHRELIEHENYQVGVLGSGSGDVTLIQALEWVKDRSAGCVS